MVQLTVAKILGVCPASPHSITRYQLCLFTMDLRRLEYFLQVVESASFSRAAIAMRMAQSTLSRQVAELEQEIGRPLLIRTGRGVAPTEAGHVLLAHARSILASARQAHQELEDLSSSPRGQVTIGMPPLIALKYASRLAKQFRAHFPLAMLTITEGLSLHLRDWLCEGRLDLAILFDPQPSSQLEFELLGGEPLVLVAPPNAKPLPESIALPAIAGYPLILPSPPNAVRHLLNETLRPLGVALNVSTEVGAVPTMLAMVAGGAGYTILPESALHLAGLTEGLRLKSAPLGPPGISNQRMLALHKSRPITRLARETAGFARQLVSDPVTARE